MSTEQRAEAEAAQRQLTTATTSRDDEQTREARMVIITKLLLSKPIAGASAAVGRARGEAYMEALDDIPPWAIAAVVRKWRRGECGEHDYTWAPGEALLRKLALAELTPLRAALEHISGLLTAVPLEQAIGEGNKVRDPRVVAGFAKLSAELHTGLGRQPATEAAE